MKRIITLFGLISVLITAIFLTNQWLLLAKSSSTASDTMLTANQLYETGQFDLAAQAYQQLVDQGYTDSALYYNLGNAYFKQGEYGRSILNYRRAEQLAPRDTDIDLNLSLARAQVVDQLAEAGDSPGPIGTLAAASQSLFTLNELAVIALIIWILFVFLAIAFSSSRKGHHAAGRLAVRAGSDRIAADRQRGRAGQPNVYGAFPA